MMKKSYSLLLVSVAMPAVGGGAEFSMQENSAIHIRREVDNSFSRQMIQLGWEQCLLEKKIYLKARESSPSSWASVELDIKKRYPNYNLDRPTAAEPKWSLIDITIENEYFYGNRYALNKKGNKYTISTDGACEVIATPDESMEIDDGQHRYLLNITAGTGTKLGSPVESLKRSDADSRTKNIASAAQAISTKVGDSEKLVESAGSEQVAGQTCNYRVLAGTSKSKICYWSVSSYYPAIMERPIILKSVIATGKTNNVSTATKFEILRSLDSKLFTPPAEVKLQDRTKF
jgi:hypothetical protein